jgi:hypothetical protein
VSVEEDSCREVSDRGHLIVWRTDRLGMPLIETVTGPDLRTPDEVEEAILLVGRVCRSTGHVGSASAPAARTSTSRCAAAGASRSRACRRRAGRRASSTARRWRQVNLLRLRDELHRRGFAAADDVRVEHADVTELSPARRDRPCGGGVGALRARQGRRPGFELGDGPFRVRAVRLPGLAGTLAWPTQPGRTFAHELPAGCGSSPASTSRRSCSTPRSGPTGRGGGARAAARGARLRPDGRPRRGVGAGGDTVTAARRSACATSTPRRRPERDPPALRGRLDRLRADPARARPHVPGHRQPAHAGHPRAGRAGCAATLPEPRGSARRATRRPASPSRRRHYLIRRGGARPRRPRGRGDGRRPARAPASSSASGSRACGGPGVAVDASPTGRWVELFRAFASAPVLCGRPGRSWSAPGRRPDATVAASSRAGPRASRRAGATMVPRLGRRGGDEAYDGRRRVRRLAWEAHGRDCAGGSRPPRSCSRPATGAAASPGVRESPRPPQGLPGPRPGAPRGLRRPVWSDVRLVNDAGSVFEGVILPRSETFDDLHVVIKLKTGYNVGLHVDRDRASPRSATRRRSTRSPRRSSPPAGPAA